LVAKERVELYWSIKLKKMSGGGAAIAAIAAMDAPPRRDNAGETDIRMTVFNTIPTGWREVDAHYLAAHINTMNPREQI
jgi:hypothetical protein